MRSDDAYLQALSRRFPTRDSALAEIAQTLRSALSLPASAAPAR